jgi:protocatechuate 3,4-dioxygenase beta subunit
VKVHRAFPLALLVFFWTIASLAAVLPQDKGPDLRTVHGSVVDKDENPIPGSIVYLLNKKTQAIRTYVANDQGQYRFSGLDPNVDYEIHAEKDNLISATRTISSFDSRRDMEITLKLTHKKGEKQ